MLLLPHLVRACTVTGVIWGSTASTRSQTSHWFALPCKERTVLVVSCGMYSVTTTPLCWMTCTDA